MPKTLSNEPGDGSSEWEGRPNISEIKWQKSPQQAGTPVCSGCAADHLDYQSHISLFLYWEKWQNNADFSLIHRLQIPLVNQNQHLLIKLLLFEDSVSVNLQLCMCTNISETDTSNTTDFNHCKTTGRKWRLFFPKVRSQVLQWNITRFLSTWRPDIT